MKKRSPIVNHHHLSHCQETSMKESKTSGFDEESASTTDPTTTSNQSTSTSLSAYQPLDQDQVIKNFLMSEMFIRDSSDLNINTNEAKNIMEQTKTESSANKEVKMSFELQVLIQERFGTRKF